jgi:carboxylesterase type B
VSSYWTNFAKTGDPNGKGLPTWPAYRAGGHETMELGERMGPMPVAARAKLAFYLANIK